MRGGLRRCERQVAHLHVRHAGSVPGVDVLVEHESVFEYGLRGKDYAGKNACASAPGLLFVSEHGMRGRLWGGASGKLRTCMPVYIAEMSQALMSWLNISAFLSMPCEAKIRWIRMRVPQLQICCSCQHRDCEGDLGGARGK